MPAPALVPAHVSEVVADARRDLCDELHSHLDECSRDEDDNLVVTFKGRKFLVIVAPEVE
jgi:hypothetical protein